jgi:hypothetical protein
MKRSEELKQICLDVLSKDGIEDGFSVQMAESIAIAILSNGYIRIQDVVLDPQKCVQLMAGILNGFRADKPFAVLADDDEVTQEDSAADGEVSPEVVS